MLITKLKAHLYVALLFIVVTVLAVTNYVPGTWLTGWDNLHPEFNFGMNISRSLFAVWQEYQGLGLLSGMAHAADLPRQLFLALASPFMPASILRYFYHFLMLFVGVLGVFFLLKHFFLSKITDPIRTQSSFLGALFYLLNFGTVQYFYTPFEPYSTFWGMLPWEIYTALLFLENPSKKRLLLLAIVNLLAVPQAYVQTIFFVYILCLLGVVGSFLLQTRSRKTLLNGAKMFLVVFLVNAFWLLPNLYFVLTSVSVTQNAMNNLLNTDRFFEMNKARGTVADFALLRGFYYDFLSFQQSEGVYDYLMKLWRNHLSFFPVMIMGFTAFGVILLGIFKSTRYRALLIFLFAMSSIAFLSYTPIIDLVNGLFRSIPIVNQMFRNPFTKFIVPAILVFSLGFAAGCGFFLHLKKIPSRLFVFIAAVLLLTYSLPAFSGAFISDEMRVFMPKEYFELFDFFKTQDKTARIMNLPQGSYWGWGSYKWGSVGSGFLWYGIEQPILDRAFDVWSDKNEKYYWELWYSLKKKDKSLFNQILDKYQVRYIIYDQNYTPSDSNPFPTLFNQKDLLIDNSKVELVSQFGSIEVYKTKLAPEFINNVLLAKNVPQAEAETFSNGDKIFQKSGFYYTTPKTSTPDYVFPFGSLFTGREHQSSFDIQDQGDQFQLNAAMPKGAYSLSIPSLFDTESLLPTRVSAKKSGNTVILKFELLSPSINTSSKTFETVQSVEEITIPLSGALVDEPLIISINEKDYLQVNPQSSNFVFVGDTYLQSAFNGNTIRAYTTVSSTIHQLSPQLFSLAEKCGEAGGEKFFASHIENDTLVLEAKNGASCTHYQEILPNPGQSLLGVTFGYTSLSDEFPEFCVRDEVQGSCLNKRNSYNSRVGFANTEVTLHDVLETSGGETLKFQFILDATLPADKDTRKKIRIRNAHLTYYPYLGSFLVNLEIPTIQRSTHVEVGDNEKISITFPKIANALSYPNLIERNIYKKGPLTAFGLPLTGDFHLQELASEKAIRLYAKNAYTQLPFRLLDASSQIGYILQISSRHKEGLPLIVNMYSPNDYNKYIYTQLGKEGEYTEDFQTYHFVLPPFSEFEKGKELLLMSSSFSDAPSIQDINNVSLYPIPYNFITNVVLQKENATQDVPIFAMPQSVSKLHTGLYIADVGSVDTNGAMLILSQAFDSGWKAYEVKNYESGIMNYGQTMFPFFFGKEIKDHVLVNNWENGWVLNNSQLSTPNSQLIIVYLPQYLQYIGFLLLGGFMLVFLFSLVRAKVRSSGTN